MISARDIRAPRVRWGPSGTSRIAGQGARGCWSKPINWPRRVNLYQNGLKIVSCYQFGKQDTADWLGGQNAGVAHAKPVQELHVAAGGSYGAPIYTPIDVDPPTSSTSSRSHRVSRGREALEDISAPASTPNSKDDRVGRAGRAGRVVLTVQLGIAGQIARRPPICTRWRSTSSQVGGIGVDINHILKPQFRQWD